MNEDILIAIIAVGGGLGLGAYSMFLTARMREMRHRERLAMIEKGMAPSADSAGWPDWDEGLRHRPYRQRRRSGVLLIFVGFGLMLLLGFGHQLAVQGLALGGFIALIGVAHLVNDWLDRRAPKVSNPSPHDSSPPAM
jgi:type VI protein secretion system component VasF